MHLRVYLLSYQNKDISIYYFQTEASGLLIILTEVKEKGLPISVSDAKLGVDVFNRLGDRKKMGAHVLFTLIT